MKHKKKRKKDQAAHYEEFLQEIPQVSPHCAHYYDCGGCTLQEYSYEDQLAVKLNVFKAMVEEKRMSAYFAHSEILSIASPKTSRYRQKMDYICSFGLSGLRGSSFSDVVNLSECHLIEEESFNFYQLALKLSKELEIPDYHIRNNSGFLRYITVRRTRLGHQLVSFLTSRVGYEDALESIAQSLLKAGVDSVVWQISDGKGDTSFGTPQKNWGRAYIEEDILGYRFNLSTNTFFQANQEVAEKAYSMIRDHANSFSPDSILDLYSGTCTIGICLSKTTPKIIAVENFSPNRDMALKNFTLNKIDNIEYIDSDVAEFMKTWETTPGFAVCNPPRNGIDEKPLRKLIQLKPQGISYLSCNPKTLLEDLAILARHYKIESTTILDMFPQTKHFETLVQLRLLEK